MSVVFGVVHLDGRPATRGELARLGMRAHAPEGDGAWVGGPAAFGHHYARVTPESLLEEQPLATDHLVISFNGRLDNRDELIAARGGDRSASDAALAIAAYREHGADGAGKLVGDFAFALFDARERRLLLARDLMAARPLYYASVGNRIVFSSRIEFLFGDPDIAPLPDEDGLADLLLNGYCDGHTSWFHGVRIVPPGAVVVATPGGLAIRRVADFVDREIRYKAASDYAEHFRALFAQAVSRRLRSAHPVAIAVSGGLDSSAIHCEAARLTRVPIRGVNMAYPRGTVADEHEYVEALRRQGLQIDEVAVQRVHWVVSADRTVSRTEMPGLLWEEQDRMLALARQNGCRVLLNGFFGDQMLNGEGYLIDLLRRGRVLTAQRYLREKSAWMLDVEPRLLRRYFLRAAAAALAPAWASHAVRVGRARMSPHARYAPWFTAQFRQRALERAVSRAPQRVRFRSAHAEEYRRLATSGFYTAGVTQLWNLGMAHRLETAYPFRDRDLVAFLMAIPGEVVCDGGIPKALLRRSLEGVLPVNIRERRSKGDGTPFSNHAARSAEPVIRGLLGPGALSARAGFVNPQILGSRMSAIFDTGLAQHDSAVLGWQLGDTLGLELWMRHFCAGTTCN